MRDNTDLALHLRLVHFSLVVVSVALVLAASQDVPDEVRSAREDLLRVQRVAVKWSRATVETWVRTRLVATTVPDGGPEWLAVRSADPARIFAVRVPSEIVFSTELRQTFKPFRQKGDEQELAENFLLPDGRTQITSLSDFRQIWNFFSQPGKFHGAYLIQQVNGPATVTIQDDDDPQPRRLSAAVHARSALTRLGVWDVEDGRLRRVFPQPPADVDQPRPRLGAALLSAGRLAVINLKTRGLALVDLPSGAVTEIAAQPPFSPPSGIVASRDGVVLAAFGNSSHLPALLREDRRTLEAVADKRSSSRPLTLTYPATAREKEVAWPFGLVRQGLVDLAVSTGGQRVGRVGSSTVHVWRDDRVDVWQLPFGVRATAAAFTPAIDTVALGGAGYLSIVDLHSGGEMASLDVGQRQVQALAFSADGAMLAAGDQDGAIALFAAKSAQWTLRTPWFRAHDGAVSALAVAEGPAGTRMVSGGRDFKLKLWGRDRTSPSAETVTLGAAQSIAFGPDGRHMVASMAVPRIVALDAVLTQRDASARDVETGADLLAVARSEDKVHTVEMPVRVRVAAVDARRIFSEIAQEADKRVNWPLEPFERAFRGLDAATKNVQSSSLVDLQGHLDEELKRAGGQLEVFGLKMQGANLARYGIVVLLGIQAYFLLHLRTFRRRISRLDPALAASWLVLYEDRWARLGGQASTLLLPLLAAASLRITAVGAAGFWPALGTVTTGMWVWVSLILAGVTAMEFVALGRRRLVVAASDEDA